MSKHPAVKLMHGIFRKAQDGCRLQSVSMFIRQWTFSLCTVPQMNRPECIFGQTECVCVYCVVIWNSEPRENHMRTRWTQWANHLKPGLFEVNTGGIPTAQKSNSLTFLLGCLRDKLTSKPGHFNSCPHTKNVYVFPPPSEDQACQAVKRGCETLRCNDIDIQLHSVTWSLTWQSLCKFIQK